MRKIAIFNVGGGLSSYLEFDDLKIIIDLGRNDNFSPIDDFLIPLMNNGHFNYYVDRNGNTNGKYSIDQLFISHLDDDHISDYKKFRKYFHPDWMTCPNDNENQSQYDEKKQNDEFKTNIDLVGEYNETRNLIIEDMRIRQPIFSNLPLASKNKNIKLYFNKPKECETNLELKDGYRNNISLVLFLILNKKTVLIPGDLLKEGMKYLIENDSNFKNDLNDNGVDFLIASHHGLETGFSEDLFREIGGKTRLNIISEKVRSENSNENRTDVDGRYYSSDYSTGENDLGQNAVKTSMGHIVIDLETDEAEVKQITDNNDLINEFLT